MALPDRSSLSRDRTGVQASPPGKGDAILLVCTIATILIAYGGKAAHFYAYWLVGGGVLVTGAMLVILRARISRTLLFCFCASAAWILVVFLLTPTAHNQQAHLKAIALTLFYTVVATSLAGRIVTDLANIAKIVSGLVASWIGINAVLSLAYVAGLISYEDGAFAGPYGNRNLYAVTTLFLFSCWISMSSELKGQHGKLIFHVAALTLAIMILLTFSTKGLVGLLAVVFVKAWLSGRSASLVRAVPAVVAAFGLAILVGGNDLLERASEKASAVLSTEQPADVRVTSSAFKRAELLLGSLNLIVERPLTGVGVDNSRYFLFTQAYFLKVAKGEMPMSDSGAYSHSNYTEMLLNGGVLAFAAYYVPLLYLLARVLAIGANPANREARVLVVATVVLKLVLDVGMVSYSDFSHLFFVSVSWLVYKRLLATDTGRKRRVHGAHSPA